MGSEALPGPQNSILGNQFTRIAPFGSLQFNCGEVNTIDLPAKL
jgi:hypothetical protein